MKFIRKLILKAMIWYIDNTKYRIVKTIIGEEVKYQPQRKRFILWGDLYCNCPPRDKDLTMDLHRRIIVQHQRGDIKDKEDLIANYNKETSYIEVGKSLDL